jgi:threonine synthase
LSTAHPAKFPDAVARATGIEPPVPERLAAALEGEEHYDVVSSELQVVEAAVRAAVAS